MNGPVSLRMIVLGGLLGSLVMPAIANEQWFQEARKNDAGLATAVQKVVSSIMAAKKLHPEKFVPRGTDKLPKIAITPVKRSIDSQKKGNVDKNNTAGASVRLALADALRVAGFEVSNDESAGLILSVAFQLGSYEVGSQQFPIGLIDYKLNAGTVELVDSSSNPSLENPAQLAAIANLNTLCVLAGANCRPDSKHLNDDIIKSLETAETGQSKVAVRGALILPTPDSSFGIEILSAELPGKDENPAIEKYESVVPVLRDGVPVLLLNPDVAYGVRIHNLHKDYEIAAQIYIDGISSYTFSEQRQERSGYVIFPPNSPSNSPNPGENMIIGWHKKNGDHSTFVTGRYTSTSQELIQRDATRIGTISVEFVGSWKNASELPKDDKERGRLLTKPGAVANVPLETVTRSLGPFRGVVTVRYESPD